jgi:hypothetical protein
MRKGKFELRWIDDEKTVSISIVRDDVPERVVELIAQMLKSLFHWEGT